MKLWWAANIYWITCVAYFSYQLHVFDFDTSGLGEGPSRALIAFVMICASVMILEFQLAWFMYLKYRDQDEVKKLQLRRKKHKK